MSRIDDRYVKALGTFTDALGDIVDIMKDQQKNKKEDVVNDFSKTPMGDLNKVVNDIKEIKKTTAEGFKDLKSQNTTILERLKKLNSKNETGMVGEVGDTKNKNKIVDGLKVIMLIAGGVLAMGMAFKIIGKVDFLSVIALSTSMLFVSKIFSQIADLKNLKYAEIFKISSIMPIMSASLLASGLILSAFPSINLMQGISILLVGSTLGLSASMLIKTLKDVDLKKDYGKILAIPVIFPIIAGALLASALILNNMPIIGFQEGLTTLMLGATMALTTWAILNGLKGVDIGKNFAKILLIPIIFPIIAASLVISGLIINEMPIIGFKQGLSALFVGATLGLTAFLILKPLGKIKKNQFSTLLALPIILPAIALGLYASSFILNGIKPIKDPIEMLKSAVVIGLSVLVFVPVIKLVGKMKFKDIATGAIAIPMIALAVVTTARIFEYLPNNMKNPDAIWTLETGLSVLAFGLIAWGIGKIGIATIAQGAIGILAVAGSILATAWILSLLPSDMKSPDYNWTLTTGLSVLAFGLMSLGVGLLLAGPQAIAFGLGLIGILAVAGTIVGVSHILGKGKYDKYPSIEWSKSVGGSLLAFSLATVAASVAAGVGLMGRLFGGGENPVMGLAQTMVDVAKKLNEVNWSSAAHPSKEYTEGVGGMLESLANIFSKVSKVEGFNTIVSKLFGGGDKKPSFTTFIENAADAMLYVRDTLNGSWNVGYPTLDYTNGVGGMLESFANIFGKISKVEGFNSIVSTLFGGGEKPSFTTFIENAADAMLYVRDTLDGDWKVGYPTLEYTKGVGGMLLTFADIFGKISKVEGFNTIVSKLFGGGEKPSFTTFIENAADAMLYVRDTLDGNWNVGYPTLEYTTGVGGMLESLANVFVKVSKVGELDSMVSKLFSGPKPSFTTFIKNAADAMLYVRDTLGGNWDVSYPSKDFSDGVGGLLESFANIFAKISNIENKTSFLSSFKGNKSEGFISFVTSSATAMVTARDLLTGDWSNVGYPTKDYAEGVGGFLESLANSYVNIAKVDIKKIEKFGSFVEDAANAILIVRNKLNGVDWDTAKYPKKEYTESIGMFLQIMAESYQKINGGGFLASFTKKQSIKDFADEAASSLIAINTKLNGVDWDKSKSPKPEYTNSIGLFLQIMAETYQKINGGGFLASFSKKQSIKDFALDATNALVESSKKLVEGKFDVKINKDYIDSLTYILNNMGEIMDDTKKVKLNDIFLPYTIMLSNSVASSSKFLSSGTYDNIPGKGYIKQFTTFLYKSSELFEDFKDNGFIVEDFNVFDKFISTIVSSTQKINTIPEIKKNVTDNLNKLKDNFKILSESVNIFMYEKGTLGIGKKKRDMSDFTALTTGIKNIVTSIALLSTLKPISSSIMSGFKGFLLEVDKLPSLDTLNPKILALDKISSSFVKLSQSLELISTNLEGFTNLSRGLYLMSIIDDKKLGNVLKSVDDHKNTLQVVNNVPTEQANLLATITSLYDKISGSNNESTLSTDSGDNKEKKQFYNDISEIKELLGDIKDDLNRPSQINDPW